MTMDTTLRPALPAIPSRRAIAWLLIGGFLGLMAWEIWARFITPLILGGPLEPAELVISLVRRWTGYELARFPAEVAHYTIGIVGYPVLYYIVSRSLKNWALVLDIGVWALFTLYIAGVAFTGGLMGGLVLFWLFVTALTATRFINPNSLLADCLSWGSFTWFNALGIMAPLAGLPFLLLEWGGGLSFMSYAGHIIFGFVASLVFEMKAGRHA